MHDSCMNAVPTTSYYVPNLALLGVPSRSALYYLVIQVATQVRCSSGLPPRRRRKGIRLNGRWDC